MEQWLIVWYSIIYKESKNICNIKGKEIHGNFHWISYLLVYIILGMHENKFEATFQVYIIFLFLGEKLIK